MRGGQREKEKAWADSVQSDVRAFGMAEDWKATPLEAGVWIDTVTEGGRRFMSARRSEEDATRHIHETRKTCYRTGKRTTSKVTPISLVDEPNTSRTGMRLTELSVAPAHVDE